jgi:hypothetical protein
MKLFGHAQGDDATLHSPSLYFSQPSASPIMHCARVS